MIINKKQFQQELGGVKPNQILLTSPKDVVNQLEPKQRLF
jgi:hypothetical protein